MTFHKTILALALAAAAAPAAFANSGSTWVGGEAGFQTHAPQGAMSREQVRSELGAFRNHPVTSDGYELVQGELGNVRHQHAFEERKGVLGHAAGATMGNAAAVGVQPAGRTIGPMMNGGPN